MTFSSFTTRNMREPLSITTTHELLYVDGGAYLHIKTYATWENCPTVQIHEHLRWVPLSAPYNFKGNYTRD